MKKIFALLWFFCALSGYAQTWTEIENNSGRTPKECTVITKEQWERLIRQYGEDYRCEFIYLDSTDLKPPGSIRGYYYLRLKRHINFMGYSFDVPGLAYGNTATGRMELFYADDFNYKMGTPEYTELYNRYIRRVNADQAETPPAPARAPAARQAAGGPGVYVAGSVKKTLRPFIACYWKDGQRIDLTDENISAHASAIAVSGNDVYVAVNELNDDRKWTACYWKNGQRIVLPGADATTSAIAVSGNDVYVAGNEYIGGGKRVACYWKNGQKIALTGESTHAEAHAIAVSGNDVYVAGEEWYNANKQIGCYWKNGRQIALNSGNTFVFVRDIAVSGNDVYVTGWKISGKEPSFYWKNGQKIVLGRGDTYGATHKIAISGNDVYVSGTEQYNDDTSTYCYWKNGEKIVLPANSSPYIAISGNDVYVTGGIPRAAVFYWKNGQQFVLPGYEENAAHAIVVVGR